MKRKAKFILDKPKSDQETHIFLKLTCDNGVLKYSTQQKTLPNQWDSKQQRSLSDRSINRELDRLFEIVAMYIEGNKILKNKILKEDARKQLDETCNRKERNANKKTDFFQAIDSFIADAKEGRLLTPSSKKYEDSTLANWERTKNFIRKFNNDITFNNVTLQTYNDFIHYCHNKSLANNYIDRYIKDWKRFMDIGHGKNMHSNLVYKHPKFKRTRETVQLPYLNLEEINKIYNYDLSHSKYLQRIRDRYIINMFTGLRISDMKSLSEDNFNNNLITHINKKTSKKVVIPVHKIIKEIIEKYEGVLPPQYHQNITNREIKKIARLAGLTEKIRYTKTVGGKKKEFTMEKWQAITNHTSRRSLASNLLKDADVHKVMPIMGMSLKTLMHYNKVTAEENAELMKTNPFFNC